MTNFGGAPRFSDWELEARVAIARDAVELVAFDHSSRRQILDTFVEVYREMEADKRLDGACHLLAAHAHVVLIQHGVANELHIGETLWSDGTNKFYGTHSWVEVGDLRFDVAMARPSVVNPFRGEQGAILGAVEIPSGRMASVRYDVRGELDDDGRTVAKSTIAGFAAGLRENTGLDFWLWIERTCKRMGLPGRRGAKLSAEYGRERWSFRDPTEAA